MAGAGGYGALFLPPPVCPEKNLVAQNYAANTLHARTRESSRGVSKMATPYTRIRESSPFHQGRLKWTPLHTTRVSVKRCKRTGKTTETVFEKLKRHSAFHSTRTLSPICILHPYYKNRYFSRKSRGSGLSPFRFFARVGGGYAITCRRGCRCSSTLASSASCLPYRISFACSTEGRRAPASAPPEFVLHFLYRAKEF